MVMAILIIAVGFGFCYLCSWASKKKEANERKAPNESNAPLFPEKTFRPKYGQKYWHAQSRGEPLHFEWRGDSFDEGVYNDGRVFKTRREARAATKRHQEKIKKNKKTLRGVK